MTWPDGTITTTTVYAKTEKGSRKAALYASMRAAAARHERATRVHVRKI